jgi:hypothetical protein
MKRVARLSGLRQKMAEHEAKRIALCVNFCLGVPDKELWPKGLKKLLAKVRVLEYRVQQRTQGVGKFVLPPGGP